VCSFISITIVGNKWPLHIILKLPLRPETLVTPGKVTFKITQQLFTCSILQAMYDLNKVWADRKTMDEEIKADVIGRLYHSITIVSAMRENLVLFPEPFPGIKYFCMWSGLTNPHTNNPSN
jgi:hypothetical protein